MVPLLATALIVLLVAALSVYGPAIRQRGPAGAQDAEYELTPVPEAAGGRDPISRIVNVLRVRPWARMLLTTASIGLAVAAIGTIGYPFYTNLLQSRIQSRLDRQIASPELEQDYRDRNVQIGDSLTRIIIPKIDVNVVVGAPSHVRVSTLRMSPLVPSIRKPISAIGWLPSAGIVHFSVVVATGAIWSAGPSYVRSVSFGS